MTFVAFVSAVITLLIAIPFTEFQSRWVNVSTDLVILFMNATVVRVAISQNLTFFHRLYARHRYEFHRHIKRELPKQVLLFLSFCLLDVAGLVIYLNDCLEVGCSAWVEKLGLEGFLD